MQLTYFRRSAWLSIPSGSETGSSARNATWAAARYWLHAPVTSWASPAAWGVPGRVLGPGNRSIGMVTLITPWVSMIGSAWLGSPWLRIQAAHSSTSLVALPCGCGAGDPVSRPLVLARPVLVGRLATCGELEPPPHPASAVNDTAPRTAT